MFRTPLTAALLCLSAAAVAGGGGVDGQMMPQTIDPFPCWLCEYTLVEDHNPHPMFIMGPTRTFTQRRHSATDCAYSLADAIIAHYGNMSLPFGVDLIDTTTGDLVQLNYLWLQRHLTMSYVGTTPPESTCDPDPFYIGPNDEVAYLLDGSIDHLDVLDGELVETYDELGEIDGWWSEQMTGLFDQTSLVADAAEDFLIDDADTDKYEAFLQRAAALEAVLDAVVPAMRERPQHAGLDAMIERSEAQQERLRANFEEK